MYAIRSYYERLRARFPILGQHPLRRFEHALVDQPLLDQGIERLLHAARLDELALGGEHVVHHAERRESYNCV